MIRCKLVEQARPDASDGVGAGAVGRAVSGPSLSLGRAASCKIYLPDPRVRLDHALIRRAEDGRLFLDASGPVLVDQHPETSIRLVRGQTIAIGPFDFFVESVHDEAGLPEAQLTLAYTLRESAAQGGKDAGARPPAGPREGWLTRRRLSWLLSLLVLALCGALPLWQAWQPLLVAEAPAATRADLARHSPAANWLLARTRHLDRFWNPGPVSSAHQTLAGDCRACHAQAFERVADASCKQCHQTVGAHIADAGIDQSTFPGQRCASCHKDHQGRDGMRVVDAVGCAECHADIRRFSPSTTLREVSDFARDHPAFRLSLLRPGAEKKGVQSVLRVAQTPALRQDAGLKFPHDKHLAQAGIKSPTGPAATGGRVVLECANCHRPDAAGTRFEAVRMDQHCQSCHRLSVDPQAPDRQLPHGPPALVRTAVREIYASLAVDRYPVSLVTVNALLQRSVAEPPAPQPVAARQWVDRQSSAALSAMFDGPQGVCRTCHEVTRQAATSGQGLDWRVAPIAATQHWLPRARFAHRQHQGADCKVCHAASQSAAASDILVPELKVCQSCHAGARAERDKVVSRCESCHAFHGPTPHPVFERQAARVGGRP